ncbi:MAG: hypothetical protein E6J86_04495 [Deltaproteobacteria bacterium]|nr:MAG: hypothetical protein E6J86_04495 [Deltaproteobacteria bacterium]
MRLLFAALATIAIGWGVVLAAPKPAPRRQWSKAAARRETAEQLCKAQGPKCRLVVRPDAPLDLTGAGCVCDAEPARD